MREIHLDTDTLLDLLEKETFDRIVELAEHRVLRTSVIVYIEIMSAAYAARRDHIKAIIDEYITPIPLDRETADSAARLRAELAAAGQDPDMKTLIIATTAITRKAALWTKNREPYEKYVRYGLKIIQ